MKKKIAVITVELVDESFENANEDIKREFTEWFKENAFLMPWTKEVRSIEIIEEM
ncbi:MAG: hypothetical protein N0A00_02310 [Candidatus Bathyarchaeota archaeon]|nr:hypothetical protein [Candidatus Bathyarchaeota archaeon]